MVFWHDVLREIKHHETVLLLFTVRIVYVLKVLDPSQMEETSV